ncbi:MAG: hypothetical protein JRN68_01215 [Nitrososphaerota archaeon]|jgi:uncharacterized Zn finger protein (UPF0148 family)|nr:hypothetical protein [Nitrososphaerota archaeon]
MDKAAEKFVVDLMRHGATLLKEPCPKCGGIMVRYKGKDICPVDSGVSSIQELDALTRPVSAAIDDAISASKAKLEQLTKQLGEEKDPAKLGVIIDDISRLTDLIAKLEKQPSK